MTFTDSKKIVERLLKTESNFYLNLQSQQIMRELVSLKNGQRSRSVFEAVKLFISKRLNFFSNIILALYSISTLIYFSLRKKHVKLHYLIDYGNIVDFRSKMIWDVISSQNCLNIYRSINAKKSLFSLHTKKNAIFFDSLVACFSIVNNIADAFKMLGVKYNKCKKSNQYGIETEKHIACSISQIMAIKLILRLLKVEVAIMIDDPRVVPVLCFVFREYGIYTYGYQHGKFNEFHLGLKVEYFDHYLVWNDYFKFLIK